MNRDELMQCLSDVEDALSRMDGDDGIWQNNIIRVILRALWYLLTREVRRNG